MFEKSLTVKNNIIKATSSYLNYHEDNQAQRLLMGGKLGRGDFQDRPENLPSNHVLSGCKQYEQHYFQQYHLPLCKRFGIGNRHAWQRPGIVPLQ